MGKREGENRERGRERGKIERGRLMKEFSMNKQTGFITFNKFGMVHD